MLRLLRCIRTTCWRIPTLRKYLLLANTSLGELQVPGIEICSWVGGDSTLDKPSNGICRFIVWLICTHRYCPAVTFGCIKDIAGKPASICVIRDYSVIFPSESQYLDEVRMLVRVTSTKSFEFDGTGWEK